MDQCVDMQHHYTWHSRQVAPHGCTLGISCALLAEAHGNQPYAMYTTKAGKTTAAQTAVTHCELEGCKSRPPSAATSQEARPALPWYCTLGTPHTPGSRCVWTRGTARISARPSHHPSAPHPQSGSAPGAHFCIAARAQCDECVQWCVPVCVLVQRLCAVVMCTAHTRGRTVRTTVTRWITADWTAAPA